MAIQVGDKIPSAKVKVAGEKGGGQEARTDELFGGKKVVLFAVPGAFTPTCSEKHLPSFIVQADELKKKGVEMIACVSVNDAFVMSAWGNANNAHGSITFVADGNGEFTRAMGLVFDGTPYVMGERSQRYAAIVENGVVKHLGVEESGKYEASSAEAILAALG
jgi:peroxiredoxin